MAWDEKTDDVALKQVVETYINETAELTHVFVNGEEIIATPTHPFYCPTKGWTDAARLRAGDILVLVNGEYTTDSANKLSKTNKNTIHAECSVSPTFCVDLFVLFVCALGRATGVEWLRPILWVA